MAADHPARTWTYPILALTGEAGAAKSFTAEMLRTLPDPHVVRHRSLPRDVRDLYVAAMNGHILIFDNLSGPMSPMPSAGWRAAAASGG